MSAIGDGNTIRLVARDKNNQTSNDYSIVVGETDKEFIFNFKRENLMMLLSLRNNLLVLVTQN